MTGDVPKHGYLASFTLGSFFLANESTCWSSESLVSRSVSESKRCLLTPLGSSNERLSTLVVHCSSRLRNNSSIRHTDKCVVVAVGPTVTSHESIAVSASTFIII